MSNATTVGQVLTIRRRRLLPTSGQTLVQPGQVLEADHLVARALLPGALLPVNVAYHLVVEPNSIERYMVKQIGDRVQAGEVLATYGGLFKLGQAQVLAPRSGTIESISRQNGMVAIREPSIPVERYAYLPGRVVEVIPNEGAVIEATVQVFSGVFGVGGERFGRLLVLCADADSPLTPEMITPEAKGRIILGGADVSASALQQAARIGVAGIIAGGVRGHELTKYLGYEIGVPITGQEDVNTTLIVTEGFGDLSMNQELHAGLKACAGRIISINGTTHLRSNVLRPEMIIPLA